MSTKVHNPLEGKQSEMTFSLKEATADERVSIIIVHRDRPQYLNICLQSIAVNSVRNSYEVIIIDNGSTTKDANDFLDYLESKGEEECKIIRNEKNLWWSKAANQGVKIADKNSKYFIFMHSDVVILNSTWIDILIGVSESQDSGLVGVDMKSYEIDGIKADYIEEWCMLVRRDCFDDCNGFPEELPQIGPAFILTRVAQINNYKPQIIHNQIVHHYRILAIDTSDHERLIEQAKVVIPTVMRNLQSLVR